MHNVLKLEKKLVQLKQVKYYDTTLIGFLNFD